MAPQRTAKSTIKNDPFETLIPIYPPAEDPLRRASRPHPAPEVPPPAPAAPEPVVEVAPAVEQPDPAPAAPRSVKTPEAAPAPAVEGRQKLTVHLEADVVNRVKNAAYWNPRLTIAKIAERGIRLALKEVEKDHGGAYPQREGELVGGRPIK